MEQVIRFLLTKIFLLYLHSSLTIGAETYGPTKHAMACRNQPSFSTCDIYLTVTIQGQAIIYYATDVTCLSCDDVTSPGECQRSKTCGKGEICYTREFTDHQGVRGFHLGCEDEARCNIFLNAKLLFGKRDVSSAVSGIHDKCYECCSGDKCNGQLCQGRGGAHVAPTLSPNTCPQTPCHGGCPTAVCPNSAAPSTFVSHKNSCYLIATWKATWEDAREQCNKQGADLVSVNSQDEQDYLVRQLNVIATTSFVYFWTGGVYSQVLHEWEWVDRAPLQYTHWSQGAPGTLYHNYDYHIAMANPYNSTGQQQGAWGAYTDNMLPFICEKQNI